MRNKIKYRIDLQPLVVFYGIVTFAIITIFAVIYDDYQSVPWYYYLVAFFGMIVVDIYVLDGRRFDS